MPDFKQKLGAEFPNFDCKTTKGDFKFHEFLDSDSKKPHTILFSHPKDFTPVCTTELGTLEKNKEEFAKRGVKLIGISCDSVEDHHAWSKDVLANQNMPGDDLSYPIIADPDREIVTMLGMLDPNEKDAAGIPLPARALFVIGPDHKLKLSVVYPATTGRNYDELIRTLDSLRLTADFSLATPVDWKRGERVIVAPSVATEDAKKRFKNLEIKELPSGKSYLRYVDAPEEF
ncbi:Peroxiredoxin-6 [Perkinsus olseni]|uniref:Peroxiredoxin-6 n=1 Tax=Perkinsus olseni TaxID=32597 RepID=A0A7J6M4X4_PEROL|nr:Peroxiredoxin-6 [Perkinsus olseni]KAF4666633.1 Peroxiredoxin-6 [Perkinsus olseni]